MDNTSPIKLSIITVNLNNADGLRKTLDSVACQTFTDYEHLIIDGGSTDGSIDIIKAYEAKYNGIKDGLYWVSEPDKGIYNAMNKGIKVAKGDYCLFLNSGDWLIEKTGLQQIFDFSPTEDIVYFNVNTTTQLIKYPEKITLYFLFKATICHQAHLIKRDLFNTIGLYDEKFKIVADWLFLVQSIIIKKSTCKYYNLSLAFFDTDGISSDSRYAELIEKERSEILLKYFSNIYDDYKKFIEIDKELQFYKCSKPVQIVKKIQTSKFYKQLRGIK